MRLVLALLLVSTAARADRYVIQRGETLEHVATAKGCSVEALQRANNLKTTLVRPGTAIDIPDCSIKTRARVRTTPREKKDDDTKAAAALSVIDGATWQPQPQSGFAALAEGEGYELRRPQRARTGGWQQQYVCPAPRSRAG